VTFVALVTIIALAAAGLIVVMLAITHVERIDDVEAPPLHVPSERSAELEGEERLALAPSDTPSPRETPEVGTPRAPKPPRRSAWHGITQAWTSWRHGKWAHYMRRVVGPAAFVAFLVVVGYLVAHI
jgi:hypothetical protein